jgi:catechol-2,3-dioxygenase
VGLAPGFRPPFPRAGHWLYTGRDAVLHLTEADADEARTADARSTFDHVAFVCKDRAGFERSLLDHGIAFRTTSVPGARTVQIFLRDPAGNGVELNFDDPADTA